MHTKSHCPHLSLHQVSTGRYTKQEVRVFLQRHCLLLNLPTGKKPLSVLNQPGSICSSAHTYKYHTVNKSRLSRTEVKSKAFQIFQSEDVRNVKYEFCLCVVYLGKAASYRVYGVFLVEPCLAVWWYHTHCRVKKLLHTIRFWQGDPALSRPAFHMDQMNGVFYCLVLLVVEVVLRVG